MSFRLGVPSKGRLQESTINWFSERGIVISRTGAEREYRGSIEGVDDVELVLISAAEVPRELTAGRLHIAVTGQDMVREEIPLWDERLVELQQMGFGFADLIVAVPAFWVDVSNMSDLDSAAAAFRSVHGHRLRVATKYHHLVHGFFAAHGVADYQLVDSQGATEGSVRNLTAEAVADITSTGSTLHDNHLKILDDGLILKSQATLFASRTAPWGANECAVFRQVCERLGIDCPEISYGSST